MRFKIPKSFKFGVLEVKVRASKDLDDFGDWDHEKALIRLDKEIIDTPRGQEIFLHEALHVIDDQLHLGMDHKHIYAISVGLAQILDQLKAKKG